MAKLFLLLFLFLAFPARGADFSVVINEICWMGTQGSSNDEWIELFNNSNSAVDLEGWSLKAKDGSPEISLKGQIPAKGFFLLERTDDNTLPEASADLIYKGALENTGEELQLLDGSGILIDEISSLKWPAGDNKTKQTMARTKDGSWQNSKNPGGTPKAENIFEEIVAEPEIIAEPVAEIEYIPETKTEPVLEIKKEPAVEQTKEEPIIKEEIKCQKGVIFTEIMPSPEGQDSQEEWIEIYNNSKEEISLKEYQIRDTQGKVKYYSFPEKLIKANQYLVLGAKETKITLNNDKDGLELLCQDNILDYISFQDAQKGQSYGKFLNDWAWSSEPTPGKENIFPKKEEVKPEEKILQASMSEAIPEKKRNSPIYLISLGMAAFSAVSIFFLKKSLS